MTLDETLLQLINTAVSEAINPKMNEIIEQLKESLTKKDYDGPYLNLNKAAAYLDITRQTLTSHIKNGVVKCYRLNGQPRFKKHDLDAAMKLIEINLRKHK